MRGHQGKAKSMPAAGQPAQLDPGPSSHPGPRLKDGETKHNHEFDHVSLFPVSALSQHEAPIGAALPEKPGLGGFAGT